MQKQRLPTDETPNVPEAEGDFRMARAASEYYRRQGLKHQERQFDEPLLVIDGKPTDFCKLRQKESPRRQFPRRDERQRIYLHQFCRISTSTRSATRSPDSRSSRRISSKVNCTSGLMRNLEFESHSGAVAQREGFEQTRDYLQRSQNFK